MGEESINLKPLAVFLKCSLLAPESGNLKHGESDSLSGSNTSYVSGGSLSSYSSSDGVTSKSLLDMVDGDRTITVSSDEIGNACNQFEVPTDVGVHSLGYRRFRPTLVVAPRDRPSRQRRASQAAKAQEKFDAYSSAAIDARVPPWSQEPTVHANWTSSQSSGD